VEGGWSIGEIASGSHDLEGKTVGIYGAGHIGQLIAARLKPFDVKMLYYKRSRLGTVEELSLGIRYATLDEMTAACDVIVIAAPLTPETEGLFDREALFGMKRGAYIVNIARGAIVETDALVEALEEGHLGGYAGDVWYPEPAPSDHPWRNMPRHALTPHVSGTTLEAQKRYAAGVRNSLENFLAGRPIRDDYVMVADGEIQSGSYKAIYG
jgi:formate dehydrogenase